MWRGMLHRLDRAADDAVVVRMRLAVIMLKIGFEVEPRPLEVGVPGRRGLVFGRSVRLHAGSQDDANPRCRDSQAKGKSQLEADPVAVRGHQLHRRHCRRVGLGLERLQHLGHLDRVDRLREVIALQFRAAQPRMTIASDSVSTPSATISMPSPRPIVTTD